MKHLLTLAAALATTTVAAQQYPEVVGPPRSMAALGDSITRAFSTSSSRLGDRPHLSWSTGNDGGVVSHYTQLDALGGPPVAFNLAVSGADMVDIGAQVTNTLSRRTPDGGTVEYVTILMGANDACRSSEGAMTNVSTYRAQFEAAIDSLSAGLPDARIFVASIPDVYVLWEVFHTNSTAVQVWDAFNICQALLANPTSTDTADVERRARFREQVIAYNTQLDQVCDAYLHCRFDEGGVFGRAFTAADVSTVDYFHPSLAGQIRLGSESWPSTFDFTDVIAPVSTISVVASGSDDLVTLAATDDVAVRGIEYRIPGNPRWTRYDSPVTVTDGITLTYRAVDVNGNIEASKAYRRGGVEPEPTDAGSVTDAGTTTDAGTSTSDAGNSGSADAGEEPEPEPTGGCNCGSTGLVPMSFLALLALARRRKGYRR